MTPFAEDRENFVRQHIHFLADIAKTSGVVFSIQEFDLLAFQPMTEEDWEMLRRKHPDLSEEDILREKQEKEDDFVELADGYILWTDACLLDAVLNAADYQADCTGYAEELTAVISHLAAELKKKKFFSRKPVYCLPELLQDIVDALDLVSGILDNPSELAEEMEKSGKTEKFQTAIIDWQNRLTAHIPER